MGYFCCQQVITAIKKTIEGHAAFEYQKVFTNALKTGYLNLSEHYDQEKIAQKIILLEMPLIQVEGFLNLK